MTSSAKITDKTTPDRSGNGTSVSSPLGSEEDLDEGTLFKESSTATALKPVKESPLLRTGAATLTEFGKEKEELLVARLAKMALLRAYETIVVLCENIRSRKTVVVLYRFCKVLLVVVIIVSQIKILDFRKYLSEKVYATGCALIRFFVYHSTPTY